MHLFTAVLLSLAALLHLSDVSVSASPSDAASEAADPQTGASARHKRYSDSKVDLDALKENLANIEDGLSNFQKRSCRIGLNSHHCSIARLDAAMSGMDYLNGGFSPGKRSTELPEDIRSRAEILLQNLSEQKEAVGALRALLSQLGARAEQQARKRNSCAIRLANHCLTEALDRAANQYYYLQSHLSPGRRRRQAARQARAAGSGSAGTAGSKAHLLTLTSYGRSSKAEQQSAQGRR